MDSVPTLKAWAESLGGITYPLLSDFYPHGHITKMYGVFRALDGFSERALIVIDKNCVIRYANIYNLDEQPDNDVLFSVLEEISSKKAVGSSHKETFLTDSENPNPMPEADVVMYCTPWCPACRRARAFFQENGIQFVEIDITRDRTAAQRVRGWANGYETTPTFYVKGKIIVDFDKNRLAEALGSGSL